MKNKKETTEPVEKVLPQDLPMVTASAKLLKLFIQKNSKTKTPYRIEPPRKGIYCLRVWNATSGVTIRSGSILEKWMDSFPDAADLDVPTFETQMLHTDIMPFDDEHWRNRSIRTMDIVAGTGANPYISLQKLCDEDGIVLSSDLRLLDHAATIFKAEYIRLTSRYSFRYAELENIVYTFEIRPGIYVHILSAKN